MKILIVHASAGAGHKKAAEAIFNGLKTQGQHDARLVDALDYTNPFFRVSYPWTYSFMVTRVPWMWKFFFWLLDLGWMKPVVRVVRRLYNGFNAGHLQKFLVDEQFDVVITTQFLSAEVTAYLKRTGRIKSRVVCVVTDFDVHSIWVNEGIDIYTGACDFTKNKLISLGVPSDKVFVTGIPTDMKFSQKPDLAALRAKLGLREGPLTVLIATGSFGMGPIEELAGLLKDHQLLIVCGHNKALYERLKPKAPADTHVLGLVNNMDELMSVADVMVTKPGGLSIAEALVKELPMVFFSAIPGQETGNIKVLNACEVCRGESTLPEIADLVRGWAANRDALNDLRRKLLVLSKPNAAADIISLL